MNINVGIYIYDNAEVLDFSGPFEVFSTASRFLPPTEKFRVYLIGEKPLITARGEYAVKTHYTLHTHPPLNLLIVVGGVGDVVTEQLKKQEVVQWIKTQAQKVKYISSVCTGVFLLAETGVVRNHKVTTHWEDTAALRDAYPSLDVREGVRWVDDGVVSSAGISAGIDMSLYLVAKIKGHALAEKTAKQMDFDWSKKSE